MSDGWQTDPPQAADLELSVTGTWQDLKAFDDLDALYEYFGSDEEEE
jgi:hypothetical protein